MLRIRQHDAKLALEEAAASASGTGRLLGEVTSIPDPAISPEAASTSASSSAHKMATKKEVVKVATSASETLSVQKAKVLPPAFLTPGTPRKPKSAISTPFSPPSIEGASEPLSQKERPQVPQNTGIGSQLQKEAEWAESLKKGTPLPSMPSRPVSNTESWTPKARRRGRISCVSRYRNMMQYMNCAIFISSRMQAMLNLLTKASTHASAASAHLPPSDQPFILLFKAKTRAKHFTNRPKYGFFTNHIQS